MTFTLTDGIVLSIILIAIFFIIFFTFKKKKGKSKCHGCPYLKSCSKNKDSCDTSRN